jgi:uncharacterized membrane protein
MNKKFISRELFYKAIIRRTLVSIPMQILVVYLFTSSVKTTLSLTIVSNLIALFTDYVFEVLWKRYLKKRFRKNVPNSEGIK